MSKGSSRRKSGVSDKQLTDNWDRIFNGKDKKDTHKPTQYQDQQGARDSPASDNSEDVQR